jgi:hypothetical protein
MDQSLFLGKGTSALVDQDDYLKIKQYQWFLSGTGYMVGFVPNHGRFELIYLHRFILGVGPDQQVDHINGNKLDNRRCNLRLATPQQNGWNRRPNAHTVTGLKGVGWHKRRCKYYARIQYQGMRCHLGFFEDAESAALAYDAAARTLFGAFALQTIPTSGLRNLSAFWWPTGSNNAAWSTDRRSGRCGLSTPG